VREGLDRVLSVRYDAERGCSVVDNETGESLDAELSDLLPLAPESRPDRPRRGGSWEGESAAGAA